MVPYRLKYAGVHGERQRHEHKTDNLIATGHVGLGDGRVTYLTEGILRLVHRVSDDTDLPYQHPGPPRTFRRADAVPLTPGEVQLWDRVRISLAQLGVR